MSRDGTETEQHCFRCGGTRKQKCPSCNGKGQWHEEPSYERTDFWDRYYIQARGEDCFCNACNGTGEVVCEICKSNTPEYAAFSDKVNKIFEQIHREAQEE